MCEMLMVVAGAGNIIITRENDSIAGKYSWRVSTNETMRMQRRVSF